MNKLNVGKDLYIKGRIGWRGLNKDEYLDNSDYKIINATALMDGYVDWNNCGYISRERYEESSEIMLQEGDILISKDGTLGKIGYVKNLKGKCTVASGIFVLRNTCKEKLNFDYLYHILKSNIFKDFIRRNKAQGSTIPHLYQRDLENFEIDLPNLDIQEKVASILNSIDDKIANNYSILDKLEKIQSNLFNYWFYQYEFPNLDGKPYKSNGGQMKWVDELKRDIPQGWEMSSIGQKNIYISDFTANGSFAGLAENVKYNEGEKYALLIRIVDFNNNFSKKDDFIYVNKHGYDYLSKSNLHGDEIIMCNVGAVGLVFRCPLFDMPMTLGPNGIVINDKKYNNYLYRYFLSSVGQQQIKSISSGSIQMKFNKTNLRELSIVFPSDEVLNKFNLIYDSIHAEENNLIKENRKLVEKRSFLLPMLMNGQIKLF